MNLDRVKQRVTQQGEHTERVALGAKRLSHQLTCNFIRWYLKKKFFFYH